MTMPEDEPLPGMEATPKRTRQKPVAAPSTVTLRVTGPAWCTGFNFPETSGTTLSIDRTGVEVPSEDADALIETASHSGVTLSRSTS